MGGRDREASFIVGMKGEGKSPFIRNLVKRSYDMRRDKILYILSSTPKAYEDIPRLQSLTAVRKKGSAWHGQILYFNYSDPGAMVSEINDLLASKCFTGGGAIVCEDCNDYFPASATTDMKRLASQHKNEGVDMYFTGHMLRGFPMYYRGMINTITVFKTMEVFERAGDMRPLNYPNYPTLFEAWSEVKKAPRLKEWIQPHITIKTGV